MKFYKISAIILLMLLGCRKSNPTPELTDPIYLDLAAEVKHWEQESATAKSDVDHARNNLKDSPSGDSNKKSLAKDFFQAQTRLDLAEQKLKYFQIRLQTRLEVVRQSTINSVRSGGATIDPSKEYQEYLRVKAAESAPLRWEEHLEMRLRKKKSPPKDAHGPDEHGGPAPEGHAAAEHSEH